MGGWAWTHCGIWGGAVVSPEERSLVLALAVLPGREPMSSEQFLREFDASDGVVLGLHLLLDAVTDVIPLTWNCRWSCASALASRMNISNR